MMALTQQGAALLVAAALAAPPPSELPRITVSEPRQAETLPEPWRFATAQLTRAQHDQLVEVIQTLEPAQQEVVRSWLADMNEDARLLLVHRMVSSPVDIAFRFARLAAELRPDERKDFYISLIGDAPVPRVNHFFDLLARMNDAQIVAGLRERWRIDDLPNLLEGVNSVEEADRLYKQFEAEEEASNPEFHIFRRPLPGVSGGEVATIAEAPFQVELFKSGASATPLTAAEQSEEIGNYGARLQPYQRWHVCGGILIAPNWVLTAAHCIRIPTGGGFLEKRRIRTGTDDVNKGGANWRIDAVVKHGGYRSSVDGDDIALIRIAADAETRPAQGRRARIARLASFADAPLKPGDRLMVTGFGVTGVTPRGSTYVDAKGNPKVASDRLMKASLRALDVAACNNHPTYKKERAIVGRGQICAIGATGVDACQGDSGGPLSRTVGGRQMVIGLVSYGYGCGIDGTPGVYVDVRAYRQWIEQAKKAARTGQIVVWPASAAR